MMEERARLSHGAPAKSKLRRWALYGANRSFRHIPVILRNPRRCASPCLLLVFVFRLFSDIRATVLQVHAIHPLGLSTADARAGRRGSGKRPLPFGSTSIMGASIPCEESRFRLREGLRILRQLKRHVVSLNILYWHEMRRRWDVCILSLRDTSGRSGKLYLACLRRDRCCITPNGK